MISRVYKVQVLDFYSLVMNAPMAIVYLLPKIGSSDIYAAMIGPGIAQRLVIA
jgi:hypothetical protein